ncbi:ATP-dependent helicase [Salinarimonas sp.]|uniref:ATP-dependent helicase n=1 Tax=Salinarimonas sp. TaxID=2766526 RepID=UPI00391D71F1
MEWWIMPWDDNLDPQSPAYMIASETNDNIRVVAGPGTGKSFAMKRRVARLLESGVAAQQILPVTFTRVAAGDLQRELGGMDVPGSRDIVAYTLHSLAFRILARNHVLQQLNREPRPLNEFELEPFYEDLRQRGRGKEKLKKLKAAYEAAWARLQVEEPGYVADADDREFERDLLSWMRFHRSMLIGEVIPHLYVYLRDNPIAAERREFPYILVDEYQDLNKVEQSVIDLLSEQGEVCIVGDDDQSIYSFKHAHPNGIRDWVVQRPNVADLTLSECRRCPVRVTHMANSLILNNNNRPVVRELIPRAQNGDGVVSIRQYQSLEDEVNGIAQIVIDEIQSGVPEGDILILTPRRAIGMMICNRLRESNVNVRSYVSESEIDEREVQRQLALLKLHIDRDDRVALRWLLGYGSPTWRSGAYARVREICEAENVTPYNLMVSLSNRTRNLPNCRDLIQAFDQITEELALMEGLPELAQLIDYVFPEAELAYEEIRNLASDVLATVNENNPAEFLRELVLSIAKPEPPEEVDEVRVMSLHKSKGLSSPVTIITSCIQGLMPNLGDPNMPAHAAAAALEEQRRLFYVAITRVKADPNNGKPGKLYITYPASVPTGIARSGNIAISVFRRGQAAVSGSQFINELGPSAPRPVRG